MIVEVRDESGEDGPSNPSIDLGAIFRNNAEPKGQKVVCDPITTATCSSGFLGNGGDTLEKSKLDQIFDDAAGAGTDRLLNLVILRATGCNCVEDLSG
jgi:hypothetical protein